VTELKKTHAALADLLARHGEGALGEESGGRLSLRLGVLSADEERLVGDRRNQRACSEAALKVFGRTLVLAGATGGASPPRATAEPVRSSQDPLTQRMIQDYEGTVEELS
jgi:hypothetical protein